MKRDTHGRASEAGASAVEFALVLFILLPLLFGIIQYGMYFWAMQGGSAAAREAARRAAVTQPVPCDAFQSEVEANISSISHGNVTVIRQFDATPVTVGADVTVTVAFDSFDMGLIPVPENGRVAQTATARVEYISDESIGDCP